MPFNMELLQQIQKMRRITRMADVERRGAASAKRRSSAQAGLMPGARALRPIADADLPCSVAGKLLSCASMRGIAANDQSPHKQQPPAVAVRLERQRVRHSRTHSDMLAGNGA